MCLCQDNEGSGRQDVVTGVEVTKLQPVSDTPNDKFPEARKFMDKGYHRLMYRFSSDDYKQLSETWNGLQVDTGEPREVVDGPPEGEGAGPHADAAAVRPRRQRRGHRGDRPEAG